MPSSNNSCAMCGATINPRDKQCPTCAEPVTPSKRQNPATQWLSASPNAKLALYGLALLVLARILGYDCPSIVIYFSQYASRHVARSMQIGAAVLGICGALSMI